MYDYFSLRDVSCRVTIWQQSLEFAAIIDSNERHATAFHLLKLAAAFLSYEQRHSPRCEVASKFLRQGPHVGPRSHIFDAVQRHSRVQLTSAGGPTLQHTLKPVSHEPHLPCPKRTRDWCQAGASVRLRRMQAMHAGKNCQATTDCHLPLN